MNTFNISDLQQLYVPPPSSHKGQNGKLLIIGGSHLFHAASLWALEIASKIVDMVFYSSVPENEKIVQDTKEAFRNGIIVPREHIEDYVKEADAILLGPGMVRKEFPISNVQFPMSNIADINNLPDEGEQTYYLTDYLLEKFPEKKWILDAGALQMVELSRLTKIKQCIITPHMQEFERVFGILPTPENVQAMAQQYHCVILLKKDADIVCSPDTCVSIPGGNPGMTKGGTGDILAGLVAALATKNDLFLAAKAGSFLNKKAGEQLCKRVGYYFNASDLLQEIPKIMKKYIQGNRKVREKESIKITRLKK